MITHQIHKIIVILGVFLIQNLSPNALIDAIKKTDINQVQQLIGQDNSLVNKRDETGTPPLLYAYDKDKTAIAKSLIFFGADGHVDSNAILTKAAGAGNQELVEWLITQGIQLQPDGNAYRAALSGGFQTIADLLKKPNPKNHGILQVDAEDALKRNDWKSIRDIIELGLPLDRRIFDGNTLIFYAIKAKKPDELSYLLKKGASPNILNNAGESPLILTSKDFDLFILLADNGADLNINDGLFLTLAAQNGSLKIIKELLRRGIKMTPDGKALKAALDNDHLDSADILIKSDQHNKKFLELRLPSARAANDWKTIKFLIENGLSASSKDEKENSLLHTAVTQQNLDAATFLLKNGANPSAANKEGITPFLLARTIPLIQLFETYKVNIHSNNDALLVVNAREGNLDVVKYLVNKNALVGPDNKAIFAAYENEHEEVGDFLAESFPKNLPPEEKIVQALKKQNRPELELLKKQNFSFSTPVKRGKAFLRPLWFAIKTDSPELVALLLSFDINPNQPIKTIGSGLAEINCYPIHLATAFGNLEIVKLLFENPGKSGYGANLEQKLFIQNSGTITASDIANAREWKPILDYLMEKKAPKPTSSPDLVAKVLAQIL